MSSEEVTAVFGDVGGHYAPLLKGLTRLGVDHTNFHIPKGLTIVQSGDLIHKGPFSNMLVEYVDDMMTTNNDDPQSGQWIQLFGNHESQYFSGAPVFWRPEISLHSLDTLSRWWKTAQHNPLYHIIPNKVGKPYLVTHAGATTALVQRSARANNFSGQDSEVPVEVIANYLDSLRPDNMAEAALPGVMLTGQVEVDAGVFWAHSTLEVYSPWRNKEAQFHQIHGHAPPYMWSQQKFHPSVPTTMAQEILLDLQKRQSLWNNGADIHFICIDPGYDVSADQEEISPLLISAQGEILGSAFTG